MNNDFPRILTLLRKERGLSQKKAAEDLGVSQALLSHYEKGIRECGLEFVVRAADYYQVSCDYLLGRSPDRTGATISVEDIPEPDAAGKENRLRGSLLPTLNKKLLANSLNVIFGELQKCNHKNLTAEISAYLSVSVYKAFRLLYSANAKNPQGMFAARENLYNALADAVQSIAQANAACLAGGEKAGDMEGLEKGTAPVMTPDTIAKDYPLFAASLMNLIQNTENRMGMKKKD